MDGLYSELTERGKHELDIDPDRCEREYRQREGIPNFDSNRFAILQWGYETGGDLDEAIRVWFEMGGNPAGSYVTDAQYATLRKMFKHEFGE